MRDEKWKKKKKKKKKKNNKMIITLKKIGKKPL